MAEGKCRELFEPIEIGKVEIKNRVVMAPMGVIGLTTLGGAFSQRAIDYYIERARGGVGLIVTSLVKVENQLEARSVFPCVSMNSSHFIQMASELTEGVHAYGTKILMQLTGGSGRVRHPRGLLGEPVAPSAIPYYWNPKVTCREISTEEIERLIEAFGDASEIAVASGFDGVEIHAVHEGYLIDQFTIAMFNRRTDKYGGDLRGRLTLPIDIVKQIKKKVGSDFPVSLRYSIKSYIKDWNQGALPGEEFKEAGRDTQEGLEAAAILEAAGYDAFNADTGSYDAWYWAHPPLYQKHGCNLDLTEKLKKVVTVPVIVAGRMDLPEMAAAAIAEGKADMVALGRGLLAEPQWVNKTFEGRSDNLRPCLGCHDGCFGRISLGRPISCAVNPACGRERDYSIESARNMRTVVIIGGGVAGMEASRVASIRGHEVRLYEKNDHLGGHLLEASVPAFKRDVARLLKWYESELVRLGVDIHLGKEFAVEHLLPKESSVVLVATGSQYAIASIPGSEKGKMATATEFLLGKRQAVDPIVVVGGGLTGCETALWLAQQNHNVTIIEMLEDLMQSGIPVFHANRTMLLDLLKFHEVKWLTNTTILGIGDEKVDLIDKSFRRSEIPARTVVMATGLVSDPRLFQSVRNMTSSAYIIGDAKRPGNIMTAIWDAYEIARNI